MELFILLAAGSAAGLFSAIALPFIGSAIERSRQRVQEIEKSLVSQISRQKERIDFLSESIDNAGKAFERLHVQLDGVENDLERHKLSSLSTVSGKTSTFKLNVPVKKARKTLDKIKQSGVQSAVVKNATKQGGKRANKSRNR